MREYKSIPKWMDPREDIEILTNIKRSLKSRVIPKNSELYKRTIKSIDRILKQLHKQKKLFEKEGLI